MQKSEKTEHAEAVAQLLGCGHPFALYRLPGQSEVQLVMQTEGDILTLAAGNATTLDEGATTLGEGATTLAAKGAKTLGEGATTLGEGATTLGEGATTLDEGATTLTAKGAKTLAAEGATPPTEAGEQARVTAEPCGFLYAPFCEAKCRPTVVIRPDVRLTGWPAIAEYAKSLDKRHMQRHALPQKASNKDASTDALYGSNFERMMQQIRRGRFEKLVLSHCLRSQHNLQGQEGRIFDALTQAYPKNMVHLISTPATGVWMGSTPELLLERHGETWRTMALAGTKEKGETPWDEKNRNEQDIVRRYVAETLTTLGADVDADAQPQTIESGQLQHLRTEFRFRFEGKTTTLAVARHLHPTPAVCGMPKAQAYAFLTRRERVARNYFAGYLGPINMQGETRLYVNLRCAQLCRTATYYHAGSGLTIDSTLEDERREIDQKIQALRHFAE